MRKSLLIYSLLLPFLLVSSVRMAAALSDASSITLSDDAVATASEAGDDENGVSVANLVTIAPHFDSVTSFTLPILELAHWSPQGPNRSDPASLITRHQKFQI